MSAVMLQGTMSGVGKSLLTAALCRIFRQDGLSPAPFKSQNMANNSYVTPDGLEIGRAQALQAQAAGLPPDVRMNPILLKPTSDTGSQVILNGRVYRDMHARDYFRHKTALLPQVLEAYHSLAAAHDPIVIEGAGSPVELNLKADDIVNMGLAVRLHCPVLLIGDIDRGGIFAQLLGTLDLLEPEERALVRGLIVNRFRGDPALFADGVKILEERSGIPVLGVVPYLPVDLEDEDSLSERLEQRHSAGLIDIAVIRLPHIANFTDFDVLSQYDGVSVRYVTTPGELGSPDLLILPGTKSTISDLLWLRERGLETAILGLHQRKTPILGICGGYQMLCESLRDPEHIEFQRGLGGNSPAWGGSEEPARNGAPSYRRMSPIKINTEFTEISGIGLLPGETVFTKEKRRIRRTGILPESGSGFFSCLSGKPFEGYEIHMGRTTGDSTPLQTQGNTAGTYLHGILDRAEITTALLQALADQKGIPLPLTGTDRNAYREEQLDLLAEGVRKALDISAITKIMRNAE